MRERTKDIYGRRPTSASRGKTHERIMALQHDPSVIPGTEAVLAERPPGSIAASILAFHADQVVARPVTTRRAYERSLAFFARDLAATGPSPQAAASVLDRERAAQHLDWRIEQGLHDAGELQRSALHLSRLFEWLVDAELLAPAAFEDGRAWMRAEAARRIEHAPPPFHVAASADELRDVSGDAALLAAEEE